VGHNAIIAVAGGLGRERVVRSLLLVIALTFVFALPQFAPAASDDASGASMASPAPEEETEDTVELPPLPKGISTWVYHYSDGIARQVRRFNERARPARQFRYFFPYCGSVGFDAQQRGQGSVSYRQEVSKAYAEALPPGVLIMPIMDGRADEDEFSGWTEEQYQQFAREVARHIIEDPYASGVQVDIEPFRPDHLPFYRHLTELLNAEGKYCTMFAGPHHNELLTRIFESCDIFVLSGYDLDGEGMPLDKYRSALAGAVARVQQVAEETGKHYLVGIPAAASWGEHEYIAGGGEERVETGVKQEEYVRAALEVVGAYEERPECLGLSLWHMSDPEKDVEDPDRASKRTKFPNLIRESVWKILERS
jgi:hypothetical protein